jgi:hypothetical protein
MPSILQGLCEWKISLSLTGEKSTARLHAANNTARPVPRVEASSDFEAPEYEHFELIDDKQIYNHYNQQPADQRRAHRRH